MKPIYKILILVGIIALLGALFTGCKKAPEENIAIAWAKFKNPNAKCTEVLTESTTVDVADCTIPLEGGKSARVWCEVSHTPITVLPKCTDFEPPPPEKKAGAAAEAPAPAPTAPVEPTTEKSE